LGCVGGIKSVGGGRCRNNGAPSEHLALSSLSRSRFVRSESNRRRAAHTWQQPLAQTKPSMAQTHNERSHAPIPQPICGCRPIDEHAGRHRRMPTDVAAASKQRGGRTGLSNPSNPTQASPKQSQSHLSLPAGHAGTLQRRAWLQRGGGLHFDPGPPAAAPGAVAPPPRARAGVVLVVTPPLSLLCWDGLVNGRGVRELVGIIERVGIGLAKQTPA
jgi:hypothetical protein